MLPQAILGSHRESAYSPNLHYKLKSRDLKGRAKRASEGPGPTGAKSRGCMGLRVHGEGRVGCGGGKGPKWDPQRTEDHGSIAPGPRR